MIKAGLRELKIAASGQAALTLDVEGTLTCRVGTLTREALSGASGVVGHRTTYEPSYMEMAIFIPSTLDLGTLEDLEDVSVTAATNDGKIYAMSGAWLAASPEPDLIAGTVTLRWESGQRVEEVTVS